MTHWRYICSVVLALVLVPVLGIASPDQLNLRGQTALLNGTSVSTAGSLRNVSASTAPLAVSRNTTDSIGLLRASYDSSVPGHLAEVQAVGVNTQTGDTYFCGYLFAPNPPPGTEHVGLLFKNDSGGITISAALFSFTGTHDFNCGGVAVDESTTKVYVAGWATNDAAPNFETSLLVKLTEDTAGQTFTIDQAFTDDDPMHPANNRTTGVAVDEVTFNSYWSREAHFGNETIPEMDYAAVINFNQAFDTATENFYSFLEFESAGFDGIAVRNGAGAIAAGGWAVGAAHGNVRLPTGAAFNNDGTFIQAWRGADLPNGLRGQLTRICWDNTGSDVVGVGTGDDLTTRFLIQQRVTVSPFMFLAFASYGDTNDLPAQSSGCAFDDTNKEYISGAGYRVQGAPPHRATVLATNSDGTRIQTYEFGGPSTSTTPDWVDGLTFNPITLNLSAGGGTTNANWSTDTTTFQGPQDGFDADLSKN